MLPYADVLVWLIPIIAAIISPIVAHFSRRLTHGISVGAIFLSWIMAFSMLKDILTNKASYEILRIELGTIPFEHNIIWLDLTSVLKTSISFGILLDGFSVFMANVVTFVAIWIFIFSIGYMSEEQDIGRYWFLMNIFVSAMVILVLSSNLIQMFIAWEVVGLCSWALISFWYKSMAPSPVPGFKTEGEYNAHCGLKALITTSFADAFFLIAIALVGYATMISMGKPTFDFLDLSRSFAWLDALIRMGMMPIFSIMLLSGPLGKSAQFPYHEWLPEAMAGPTTVSALIHAATMVKAGAYFVGRFFLVIYMGVHAYHLTAPQGISLFFLVAMYIGAFTAFLAGTQGMVAKELKKILAYSTISQLGYIFAIFGIAGILFSEEAFFAGALHILSHAVFKALLFLCAGAVLHAVHTKYVHEMGGLRKYMPVTFWTMIIGALSLSGVPPLAGFFSKDAIIHTILEAHVIIPAMLLIITAVITVFYSFRMIGLVFYGEESDYLKKLKEKNHHIHEAPLVMKIPLIVLATVTIIIGLFFEPIKKIMWGEGLDIALLQTEIIHYVSESIFSSTFLITIIIITSGFIPAYFLYISRKIDPKELIEKSILLRALYFFLINRWYINSFYYKIADGVRGIAREIRKVQTGVSNINIFYMILGFIIFLLILLTI